MAWKGRGNTILSVMYSNPEENHPLGTKFIGKIENEDHKYAVPSLVVFGGRLFVS
jgi:hypothetical protein